MTIIGKSMFPLKTSYQHINTMKARFDQLQGQLATGKKASNLAELGTGRSMDLTMRSRLAKIDGYQSTITTLNLRFSVLDKSMARLDSIESEQRTGMTPGGYGSSNVNFATAPTISRARLDETLDLLNSDIAGRYLFSGGTTDKKPVADSKSLIEGEGGRAGFRQVAGERKLADAGADNLGRLDVTTATNVVTLAEDGSHPFGYKLSTLATSSSGITLTQPSGSPKSLSVEITAQPIAGQRVTIGLTLPDGTASQVTLTATTSATPGDGEFQIGADENATAANFAAALSTSLSDLSDTVLSAASNFAAADNFFNGQGQQVLRVNGSPFETATSLVAASPSTTVFWYSGEDSTNPRQTVSGRVDDTTVTNYGVQANESGITQLVRTLAAMTVETYPGADDTSGKRFDAMAARQLARLSEDHNNDAGSIEVISVELGLAKTTAANVGERHTTYKSQLKTMLDDLEGAPTEEVAMELLALKTRLEASYQAASLVSQLSLVNYLPR